MSEFESGATQKSEAIESDYPSGFLECLEHGKFSSENLSPSYRQHFEDDLQNFISDKDTQGSVLIATSEPGCGCATWYSRFAHRSPYGVWGYDIRLGGSAKIMNLIPLCDVAKKYAEEKGPELRIDYFYSMVLSLVLSDLNPEENILPGLWVKSGNPVDKFLPFLESDDVRIPEILEKTGNHNRGKCFNCGKSVTTCHERSSYGTGFGMIYCHSACDRSSVVSTKRKLVNTEER